MKHLLIVCTGNMCRSPMAAALLERRLAGLGLGQEVAVESAGTHARIGDAATAFARSVMADRGLSLGEHESHPVTEAMLANSDLVIVMEEAQRRYLFHLSMRNLHKVFLLSELSGGHGDVRDPLGGTREDYEQTAQLIDRLLVAGLPRILKQLRLRPLEDQTRNLGSQT